jgi:hypothetical protein
MALHLIGLNQVNISLLIEYFINLLIIIVLENLLVLYLFSGYYRLLYIVKLIRQYILPK